MSPDEALGGESTTSRSDGDGEQPVAEGAPRRRRRTRKKAAQAEPSSTPESTPEETSKRPRRRSRARTRDAEARPAVEPAEGGAPSEEKPARSRRRSRSKAAQGGEEPVAADAPVAETASGKRPARSRRRSRSKAAQGDEEPATAESPASEAASKEKPSRSRGRTRRRKADDQAPSAGEEAGSQARRKPRRTRRRSASSATIEVRPERRTEGPEEVADTDGEPEDLGSGEASEPPARPVEKILLVNALDPEEVRIVLLEDGQVEELYVEGIEERTATGNIYRGRVQNVEQAIGAAFVELGRSETGFLHVSDLPDREPGDSITDLLEPGKEVVVQITRDRVGKKGPALSGRVSLAGRYLVLMANTDRSGVSRRIARGRQRDQARRYLNRLEPPEGMGLIIRTAGEGGGFDELKRDLDHLVSEWEALQARAQQPGAPGLLRAESDLAERSVRDIMPTDVTRIVTDREEVAARIRALLEAWYGCKDPGAEESVEAAEEEKGGSVPLSMPEVQVHADPMPLFHAYDAEPQLEEAFRRVLRLPSGGSVVIDPTEALVSIDVNSGRSTEEKDPDATALQTNLEAVEVVARQLRLRDLGGLVVVDLIDMRERKNVRAVEKAFKKALERDRARIRMGRIGPFGCVTLSRQRIRQALSRVTHEECPDCGGTGRRRHPEGLGLRVLREMRARVARARGRGGLEARVPKGAHDWIQRHRGRVLHELEKACSGPVRLTVDDRLALDGWAMKGLPPSGKGRRG